MIVISVKIRHRMSRDNGNSLKNRVRNESHIGIGSSGSQSIPSESRTFVGSNLGGTNNPIMEGEDQEYYASDQDI